MSGMLHAVQHKIWTQYVHFGTGPLCVIVVLCGFVVWMCFQASLGFLSLFSLAGLGQFTRVQDVGCSLKQALPETNDMATEAGEKGFEDVEVST